MLWAAIYELYALLVDRVNKEAAYQDWAEQNEVIFSALGYDRSRSFERKSGNGLPRNEERGFSPEPDFICANSVSGVLTIFDFKTPFVSDPIIERADGNRQKFNSKLESYISQVTEYAESIRGDVNARKLVCEELSITEVSSYRLLLVYGMGEGTDEKAVAWLSDQRKIVTEILFFDRLLERLVERYEASRRDRVVRPGACAIYHVVLCPNQIHEPAFIADHGEEGRNQLLVFLEGKNLVFRCLDSRGREHRLECEAPVNMPLYVRFECANDDEGAYLSLAVNNEERDLRVGSARFDFSLNLHGMKMGSDRHGLRGARFQMLETIYLTSTTGTAEKLETYHYFKTKVKNPHACAELDGTTFLVRDEMGNLRCGNGQTGPLLKERFGY